MPASSESTGNEARNVERAYRSAEITHQRFETLKALHLQRGERVLDGGCGPGLLTRELASRVGETGWVIAVDRSPSMLALAKERCRDLPRVDFKEGSIERLTEPDASLDAVVCTQVLLYVEDVQGVVEEMYRVLKPGGRVVVVETDWRSCVLNTVDSDLTETMIKAWDEAVPSPNLPVRLAPILRASGFRVLRVDPVPILDTILVPDGYSFEMLRCFAAKVVEQGKATQSEATQWLQEQQRLADRGAYFFCVNRFLFVSVK